MKILGSITLIFYSIICLVFGFILILLAFNTIPMSEVEALLEAVYTAPNIRITVGAFGICIVFISLLIVQFTSGKMQRERTIAFENPDGQVTISLSAIEDLIKRVGRQIPDIKELRPSVIAGKKGVSVTNRVVLFAGANIPEVTEKMQNIIRSKVQQMLGIEEPILVRVHVTKISTREKQKEEKTEEETPTAFKGIEYSSD